MLRGNAMHQQNSSAGESELYISAAGCSDAGRVREHNEDSIALCEPPNKTLSTQLGQLYLLADGAGGHAAGEVASRLAIETIAAVYYDQAAFRELGGEKFHSRDVLQHLDGSFSDLDAPIRHIRQAFFAAHTRLRKLATLKPEYSGMATTCVAAVVKNAHVAIAHMGDSRAYLIHPLPGSPPAITRLTTDHSMVSELVRVGAISPEEMHSSPSRHIVLRVLGGSNANNLGPDVMACIVQAGAHLLLCCDGLWSMLNEEQIAKVVSRNTPEAACDQLVQLANEAGGEDNISAVVLSFMESTRKT
jgi:serine/threonine protein phosphatase PrpC